MAGYGTGGTEELAPLFKYDDPRGSLEALVPRFQQRQSPISILKHFAMGSNPLRKLYDFKASCPTLAFNQP